MNVEQKTFTYQHKPEKVEAVHWTEETSNDQSLWPDWLKELELTKDRFQRFDERRTYYKGPGTDGWCRLPIGSFLIRSENGELRHMSDEKFHQLFEKI